jgi:hypothetical protein
MNLDPTCGKQMAAKFHFIPLMGAPAQLHVPQ